MLGIRWMVFYIFVIVNTSCEKTKTSNVVLSQSWNFQLRYFTMEKCQRGKFTQHLGHTILDFHLKIRLTRL